MSPSYALIGETFKADAGVANGIFSSGFYVGYGILASFAGFLVATVGLQWTFVSYSVLCGLASILCYFLVPSENKAKGVDEEKLFESSVITSWLMPVEPLLLMCAVTLRYFSSVVISSFLPVYFQQFIAATPDEATKISVIYGTIATVAGAMSTILGGLLTDNLSRAGLGNAAGWVCGASSLAAAVIIVALLFLQLPAYGVHALLALLFLATEMWIAPQAIILQVPQHDFCATARDERTQPAFKQRR